MTTVASNIYNSVSNAVSNWGKNDHYQLLSEDKEILKIGNILNSLFINRKSIDIPKLVVVGSQSSGKSSILNSILGMDILPTGSNMVTRGPLQLELIQSQTDVKASFGKYDDTRWIPIEDIEITYPNPTIEQKNNIRLTIQRLTDQYAGPGMNITSFPINLRIFSPNIPNLSLVDLPGLTMVACTDKGQPKDIKDKIKNLIGDYISKKETIIMAVMPARSDIEADIALDLIKDYDSECKRTIGILTKIDLMNEGTDITNLLENKVSTDLQLKYGYFAIKNRNKKESETMSVQDGIKSERTYFSNHYVYSNKKYNEKLGILALCKSLGDILVKSLKKSLPSILEKVNSELQNNIVQLEKLGSPIPKDENLQFSFIHKTIAKLNRSFISILEDRGKNINTGRNIKQHFIDFRETINNIEPFNKNNYDDQYINSAISNCEGNHMSFPSPPVEVLEQLMKDSSRRPMFLMEQPSQSCAKNILQELNELVDILIKDNGIDRFPEFQKIITSTCINKIFIPNLNITYQEIKNELSSQENYIWTENINFLQALNKSNCNNIDIIRNLSTNYYKSSVYIIQDVIPKKIMYFLVNKSQKNLSSELYNSVKDKKPLDLLKEVDNIQSRRKTLDTNISELDNAKKLIESII